MIRMQLLENKIFNFPYQSGIKTRCNAKIFFPSLKGRPKMKITIKFAQGVMRLPLLWHALRIRPQVWLHAGPTMSAQSNWSGGGSRRRIFHYHPVRCRKSFFLIHELTVTLNHDGMAAWSLGCAPLLLTAALHHVESRVFFVAIVVFDRLARGRLWHISSSRKLVLSQ